MASELTKEITISISNCDPMGRVRPSAILVDMQELAELHSAALGLPRTHLIENGIVWVLYRQHIAMRRYPTFGDTIRYTTWPGAIEGPIFPRHFLLEAEDGSIIGEAATSWILMDIHSRRPMRPSALPGAVPPNTERTPPLPLPGMLRIADAAPADERTVLYSDLDVNGHMNNTRYADWICDLLDIKALLERGLAQWQINYISEARPGEALLLSMKDGGDGCTLVLGQRKEDGRTVFEGMVSFL